MAIKFHYDSEDDILTIYDSENSPKETIEFSEFLNIDINKDKGIVGIEIFDALKYFGSLQDKINKEFLESIQDIKINCRNERNTWFMVVELITKEETIKSPLPPFRKTEYTSPLIASCN